MKKLGSALAMVLALSLVLCACGLNDKIGNTDNNLVRVRICLGSEPVTGLTGIWLAKDKGYYEEAGIDLEIVDETDEGAAFMCDGDEADLAVVTPVSLADCLDRNYPAKIMAVAALFPHNQTGILSRKGDGIGRPRKLTDKCYSSWNCPVELGILESLVNEDGGSFRDVEKISRDDSDMPAALAGYDTDAVWAFEGWDLVSAKMQNFEYKYFSFSETEPALDYPGLVLAARKEFLKKKPKKVKELLEATRKGYEDAISSPEEAAEALIKMTKASGDRKELIRQSQEWASLNYMDPDFSWGMISERRWKNFFSWLYEKNVTEHNLSENTFTNRYITK